MLQRASFGKVVGSMLAAGMLWASASAVNAAVILVTPSNPGNWAFDNRDVNGVVGANATASGGMVTGPDSPPIGTGSANLKTGNGTIGGDGTEELRNTGFVGVRLDALTSLSYSTYMTVNNGSQFPYLGLMVHTGGASPIDDILFFEPPFQTPATGNASLPDQGDPVLNTWQIWDALGGGWWWNSGPGSLGTGTQGTGVGSLADYLVDFPDATIENAPGTGLGGIRFNVGFASDTDQFNGYVDKFTIGVAGDADKTFNFDPDAVTADAPEPASLALLALGLAGLGFSRRKQT